MDSKLLDILACPVCKGPLTWHPDVQQLACRAERLAYPVREGIPVISKTRLASCSRTIRC